MMKNGKRMLLNDTMQCDNIRKILSVNTFVCKRVKKKEQTMTEKNK